MVAPEEITTGVEQNSDVETEMRIDADWFAFADDGEYATVQAVQRVDDETVEVETFRCEAGLIDRVDGVEQFDIDADKSTRQFALEAAEADPELAIELAREHWEDK